MPLNPPDLLKAWLWQAENYLIVQDGVSVPLFFDGVKLARSRLVPTNTKIDEGSGWQRPAVGESKAITLTDKFAGGTGVQAIIGGYQYLLSQIAGAASNTVTLKEKYVGTTPAVAAGTGIYTDPNYIGDTTNLSPPSQVAFEIPAVNTPAVTTNPIRLAISVSTAYTPGTGTANLTGVAMHGTYTPQHTQIGSCTIRVKVGISGQPLTTLSGTLAAGTNSWSASASFIGIVGGYYHYSLTVQNTNNIPQGTVPIINMTLAGQTIFACTDTGAQTSWTSPDQSTVVAASPSPSVYTSIPSTGYMTIAGTRYQYSLTSVFTDNGSGTVSATATLVAYNSTTHGAVAAGITFATDGGATIALDTAIPAVSTAASPASPLPATIKGAVGTSGTVNIGGVSYAYTTGTWSDNGSGTLSCTLTLPAYNATVHASTASGGTFTLAGYTFTLGTTIPAVTTASGTTTAQTYPVDVYVESPCQSTVRPGDTVLINANQYQVVSVTDQSPGAHLVLYNLTNSNVGSEVAIGTPITFAISKGSRVLVATVGTAFSAPGVGSSVAVTIAAAYGGLLNINVFAGQYDRYKLTGATVTGGVDVIYAQNVNDTSTDTSSGTVSNHTYPDGTFVQYGAPQLPIGRMGAYVMGRNWLSLPDKQSFVASDIVGGSSGTKTLAYRDAVLNMTENTYIVEGGTFRVPSNAGDIRAMICVPTLDASLGQGPLQVFTPFAVFSCNAPVDRSTWQSMTNPILSMSLISNGGVSQEATVISNGDVLFRSLDGDRSLVMARKDFSTWGTTPISREVSPTLNADDANLIEFESAIVFDNRKLLAINPVSGPRGVYHDQFVALNFDPMSSLRGKAASVYDGLWDGLNVLRVVKGIFAGVERCFAFCYNDQTQQIELHELMPSGASHLDNDTDQITWTFDFFLNFGQPDPRQRDLLRLIGGEMYLSAIQGPLTVNAYFRPDYASDWILWRGFTVPISPTYQTRVGLGEPPTLADSDTNRPWREGYAFMVRFEITGHAVFKGARFQAVRLPQPKFAPLLPAVVADADVLDQWITLVAGVLRINRYSGVMQLFDGGVWVTVTRTEEGLLMQ